MRPFCLIALTAVVAIFVVYLGLNAATGKSKSEPTSDTASKPTENSALLPLEMPANIDLEKAALGEALFSDPRLSKNDTISCQSCHDLDNGGADHRQFSIGVDGAIGGINAPSVFNSSLNFKQFWDGRAETLADQIEGPLHAKQEMASDWPTVIRKLSGDPELAMRFRKLYADGISQASIVDSIVEFERSLITMDAPFDKFINGDPNALTDLQIQGYRKFDQLGCISCHQGRNVGGNMFQTFGVSGDYFVNRGGRFPSDDGRFAITHEEIDRHVFKVPSLRNVALTAPYFHDGSEPNLENAVRKMAKYQLAQDIQDSDAKAIAAFLKSLTGQTPSHSKIWKRQ
jgi:cytochrome c peroxidase